MADIRLQKITVDDSSQPLIIKNGSILVSSGSLDSLTIAGGVGIAHTGGSITIAGGVGVAKSSKLGGNLIISSNGTFTVRGSAVGTDSIDRILISSDTIKLGKITLKHDSMSLGGEMTMTRGGVSVFGNMFVGGGAGIDGSIISGSINSSTGQLSGLFVNELGDVSVGSGVGDGGVPLSITQHIVGNKINLGGGKLSIGGSGVGVGDFQYTTSDSRGSHVFYAATEDEVWKVSAAESTLKIGGSGDIRFSGGNSYWVGNMIRRRVGGADTLDFKKANFYGVSTGVPIPVTVGFDGNSICWSAELGLFCAVFAHQSSGAFPSYIATSPNGFDWEYVQVSNNMWFSITWSSDLGIFCAVGSRNSNVATSRDGKVWSVGINALGVGNAMFRSVVWSPELRLFCTVSFTGLIYTSPDGINWNKTTETFIPWWSICWSSELGLFCVVSEGGQIGTSADGVSWDIYQLPSSNNLRSVIWCGELGRFFGISRTRGTVIQSIDGVTWIERTLFGSNGLISIVWNRELSILTISGGPGPVFFISKDGFTWTGLTDTIPSSFRDLRAHAWSPQLSRYCFLINEKTDVVTSESLLPERLSVLMANAGQVSVDSSHGSIQIGVNAGVGSGQKLVVGGGMNVGNTTLSNLYANTITANRVQYNTFVTSNVAQCCTVNTINNFVENVSSGSVNVAEGLGMIVVENMSSGSISTGSLNISELLVCDTLYIGGGDSIVMLGAEHTLGNITVDTTGVSIVSSSESSEIVGRKIYLGNTVSYTITQDERVFAWGNNYGGQLGNDRPFGFNTEIFDASYIALTPENITSQFTNGGVVTSIVAGGTHSVALTDTGRVYTWGSNADGELGNDSLTGRGENDFPLYIATTPHDITSRFTSGGPIVDIVAGFQFSFALGEDGEVYGWGGNGDGQIGNGKNGYEENGFTPIADVNATTPEVITSQFTNANVSNGIDRITQIVAGAYHCVGLASSGNVYTWGYSAYGQLGNGFSGFVPETFLATYTFNTPQTITSAFTSGNGGSGIDTIVSVGTGDYHSLAIGTSGNVYTWGANGYGQLGNGTDGYDENGIAQNISSTPQTITSGFDLRNGERIVSVDGGNYHSIALSNNARVFTWGFNMNGELGDGTTVSKNTPQDITSQFPEKIVAVNAGGYSSMALSENGKIYVWGLGDNGQIGDGNRINRSNPTLLNTNINTDMIITGILRLGEDATASVISGGVGVACSTEATSVTHGGGLTVEGGMGIGKGLFVDGQVDIHSDGTIAGSVDIGGVIGVSGGMSIGGDLYVSEDIVANSVAVPKMTTGGLSIASGMVVKGGFLVSGGSSVTRDIYLGGKCVVTGGSVFYLPSGGGGGESVVSEFEDYSMRYDPLTNDLSLVFNDNDINTSITVFKTKRTAASNSGRQHTIAVDTVIKKNALFGSDLTVIGGAYAKGDMSSLGDMKINSTVESLNVDTGALRVSGAVGVSKNVNVRGSLDVGGNLSVEGDTTFLNTKELVLNNSQLTVNYRAESSPTGGYLGFFSKRYQKDNDDNEPAPPELLGDVVKDQRYIEFELPEQADIGLGSNEIKLPPDANAVDDYYKGYWIKIASGIGALQVRQITGYNGTTKVATVSSEWNILPSTGEYVYLYHRSYVGLVFNESENRFELTSGVPNTDDFLTIRPTELVELGVSNMLLTSKVDSANGTTGAMIMHGGLGIKNSTEATSATAGGSLSITGGAGVSKKLYVGQELFVDNVPVEPYPTDVYASLGYTLSLSGAPLEGKIDGVVINLEAFAFDMYLSVRAYSEDGAAGDLLGSCHYHLRCILELDLGEVVQTYVGDNLGLSFTVDFDPELDTFVLKYIRSEQEPAGTNSLGFKWKIFFV